MRRIGTLIAPALWVVAGCTASSTSVTDDGAFATHDVLDAGAALDTASDAGAFESDAAAVADAEVDRDASPPTRWQLYDATRGRRWTRLAVPGAVCATGSPYYVFFSPASRPGGRTRLTAYFEGGGSTERRADGSVTTNVQSLAELRALTTIVEANPGTKRLFMDAPDNDAFIGPGHLVYFPYCTQDRHIGRRAAATVYDVDELPDSRIRAQVDALLRDGHSPESIEREHAGIDIVDTVLGLGGSLRAGGLELHLVHRGALNIESAVAVVRDALMAAAPDFFAAPEIVVSGGSAGGFGAWYHAHLFGDLVYEITGARLTLAPIGGMPVTRIFDSSTRTLVEDPARIADIQARFSFYEGRRPCDRAGGRFTPTPDARCEDTLELVRHYRDERYPTMDVRIAPAVNKVDFVIASSLRDAPNFPELLLGLCQTLHAYGHALARERAVDPYMMWQFVGGTNPFEPELPHRPEHVPEGGALLAHMHSPSGAASPSEYSLLSFVNAVAARSLDRATVHLEHAPFVVLQPNRPDGPTPIEESHLRDYAACIVPDR